MENLFIQIINGQPVNHPAFESNLIASFGAVPSDWQPFNRIDRPTPSIYQVIDPPNPTYQLVNGVWTDVWNVRDMTSEEKTAYQQPIKDAWNNRSYKLNFTAWVFDDATCSYKPPIPRPSDGQNWRWSGTDNNWKIAPEMPADGNTYVFDFNNWTWIKNGAL